MRKHCFFAVSRKFLSHNCGSLWEISDIESNFKMVVICSPHCVDTHPLQWRHNGRDGISNHQPQDCLLNSLFRRRSMKASKFRVTGLCAGNSPGTGEFPAQMASNAENVSIWWHHHVPSAVRSGIFVVAMRAKLVCVVGIILCRYLCYAEIRNLLFVRLQWNDIDCMQAYILNVGFVCTNATNYICEIKIKEDLPTDTFLQWLILFFDFCSIFSAVMSISWEWGRTYFPPNGTSKYSTVLL